MTRKQGQTYNEQLQAIANEYLVLTGKHTITTREVMQWALEVGRWAAPPELVLSKAAEELARAMREEFAFDPQGRRVRVKHAARIVEEGVQQRLWADFRDPAVPRSHIELALKQRRQQIVGDCHQLKIDTDSYNENHNPGRRIQMVFDFTLDLEELGAA